MEELHAQRVAVHRLELRMKPSAHAHGTTLQVRLHHDGANRLRGTLRAVHEGLVEAGEGLHLRVSRKTGGHKVLSNGRHGHHLADRIERLALRQRGQRLRIQLSREARDGFDVERREPLVELDAALLHALLADVVLDGVELESTRRHARTSLVSGL